MTADDDDDDDEKVKKKPRPSSYPPIGLLPQRERLFPLQNVVFMSMAQAVIVYCTVVYVVEGVIPSWYAHPSATWRGWTIARSVITALLVVSLELAYVMSAWMSPGRPPHFDLVHTLDRTYAKVRNMVPGEPLVVDPEAGGAKEEAGFTVEERLEQLHDVLSDDCKLAEHFHKKMMNGQPISTLCVRCHEIKRARTHHCRHCDVCSVRYDHHCFWIGNCVGLFNHKYFLLLVFYVQLTTVWMAVTLLPDLVDVLHGQRVSRHRRLINPGRLVNVLLVELITLALAIVVCMFLRRHLHMLAHDLTTGEMNRLREAGESDGRRRSWECQPPRSWVENYKQIFGPRYWTWLLVVPPGLPATADALPRHLDVPS